MRYIQRIYKLPIWYIAVTYLHVAKKSIPHKCSLTFAGLFGGLGCKPCYLIIANYFKRRRGLATAIMMAGMCTGQFAGPPLIRLLQETYGFRGATLIIGGIMLHSVAGAALFQPVQWHMKKEATSKDLRKQETPVDKQEDSSLINTPLTNPHAPLPLRNKRLRQVSESSASLHLSTVDISGYPTICEEDPDDYGSETSQDNPKISGAWILIGRVFRLTIADLKILKSPPALIIALGGLLSQNGYLNFMLMMPFAVQAHGYALQDAAWCVSVAGICNLVARLGTTTLSDCSWFNMRLVYVLGACIFGSASLSKLIFKHTLAGCLEYHFHMKRIYVVIIRQYSDKQTLLLPRFPALYVHFN